MFLDTHLRASHHTRFGTLAEHPGLPAADDVITQKGQSWRAARVSEKREGGREGEKAHRKDSNREETRVKDTHARRESERGGGGGNVMQVCREGWGRGPQTGASERPQHQEASKCGGGGGESC